MDWLDSHIQEIILPNLRGEVLDLTGIELDPSLGEFKVDATALDADDETAEEYEITIHFGDVCLVDACFLVEEIELGNLPICQEPEPLTESLIQAKTRFIKEQVVPSLREDFADELGQQGWDPMLAHKLDIAPETLAPATEMRSSGGYPPMALTFRHPEYDPDMFEVSIRIDPMTRLEWVSWEKVIPRIDQALRAVGEEPVDGPPVDEKKQDARTQGEPQEPEGPSADDLQDQELVELEADARTTPPAAAKKEAAPEIPDAFLAKLKEALGVVPAGVAEAIEDGGKNAAKARGKKPTAAAGKKAATKAPAKKKTKATAGKKAAPAKKKAKAATSKKAGSTDGSTGNKDAPRTSRTGKKGRRTAR